MAQGFLRLKWRNLD